MEATTKERLTGALVLVAVLVLLVPELFSGRRQPRSTAEVLPAEAPGQGPPVRTLSVETPTGGFDPSEAEPLALPREIAPVADAPAASASSLPAPEVAAAPPPVPEQKPAPVVAAAPAERPRSNAEIARDERAKAAATGAAPAVAQPSGTPAANASAAPAGRGWFVQAGSFASEANARRLQQQITARGHAVAIVKGAGKAPWRVRVGPVKDAAAARELRKQLAAQGWAGTVVAP
ncbi:MAG: hypothetical protein RL026_1217 [Pseudomonadota bacterium]|jgi:cell division septation protein DedD